MCIFIFTYLIYALLISQEYSQEYITVFTFILGDNAFCIYMALVHCAGNYQAPFLTMSVIFYCCILSVKMHLAKF